MTSPLVLVAAVLITATILVGASRAQDFNAPSSPCNRVSGTSDLVRCLNGALTGSDSLLKNTYKRTMQVLDRDDQQRLVLVERIWAQYRDASCTAEHDLFGAGTAGPSAELACLEAETQSRIAALRRAYGWRVEKFSK